MTSSRAWFECFGGCGVRYPLTEVVYRCDRCNGLLEVRHDIASLRSRSGEEWRRLMDSRSGASSGVWSRKEVVLPDLPDDLIVSMGEGNSPLLRSPGLARHSGVEELFIKQCGTSHTGSFKDLGMTVLVSAVNAIRHKVSAVACASTGDTSAALAAYGAAAGIPTIVFLPRDKVSVAQLIQPIANGALVLSLDTDFDGCMRIVQDITRDGSVYLANSMNSLRIEGQKTISFEIVQQLGWRVPDFVVVPGGNLGNVAAIGNGFELLRQLAITDRLPRLICAQAERANPLYRAYLRGFDQLDAIQAESTLATAIQIGAPVSYPKAVRALRNASGVVEQASESELAAAAALGDRHGFFCDPQTGVALAATFKAIRSGTIPPESTVVVISTAHGLKFVDFKRQFHQGSLAFADVAMANPPVDVPAAVDEVRAAIEAWLPRFVGASLQGKAPVV